jgi:hypothetical protein
MHAIINDERHDAGYLVQFAKQKRPADFDCHFSSLKRILDLRFWIRNFVILISKSEIGNSLILDFYHTFYLFIR